MTVRDYIADKIETHQTARRTNILNGSKCRDKSMRDNFNGYAYQHKVQAEIYLHMLEKLPISALDMPMEDNKDA